jgi:hypothetical protein
MSKRILILCKHPETCLASRDLVAGFASSTQINLISVYGVQNNTPKHFLNDPKVKYITSIKDNKINIDELSRELSNNSYDAFFIVHMVNVISMTLNSIKNQIQRIKVIAVCEMPREGNSTTYFDTLTEVKNHIGSNLIFAATNENNRKMLENKIGCHVNLLSPVIKLDEFINTHPLNTDDEFRILAIGRMDISLLMFSEFIKRINAQRRVRLLVSVDEASKPFAQDVLNMELNEWKDNVTLIHDVNFMSISELCRLYSNCHVVVHTNFIGDFNIFVRHLLATGHPQIIPDVSNCTHQIPREHCYTIQPTFTFYNLDEYGGKLSLCDHGSLASGLLSIYSHYDMHKQRSLNAKNDFLNKYKNQYSIQNWLAVLGIGMPSMYGTQYENKDLYKDTKQSYNHTSNGIHVENEVKELRNRLQDLIKTLGMN